MKLNLLVIAMLGAALSVAIYHGDSPTTDPGQELNLVKTQQIQEHGDHSQPTSNEDTVAWKDDPVCQMVFFAVLEGLYSQGVSDEVVESIVGQSVILLMRTKCVSESSVALFWSARFASQLLKPLLPTKVVPVLATEATLTTSEADLINR